MATKSQRYAINEKYGTRKRKFVHLFLCFPFYRCEGLLGENEILYLQLECECYSIMCPHLPSLKRLTVLCLLSAVCK